jgi:hypothetical protein
MGSSAEISSLLDRFAGAPEAVAEKIRVDQVAEHAEQHLQYIERNLKSWAKR